MRSLACYCVIFSGAIAGATSLKGVPEALQHLYEPRKEDPSKWACLGDPSIILDYSQINDDYCDCPDGSDEPGTSACGSLSRFYCPNTGFAPRYVSGFKVNDGVCDCCDCSDEPAFLESKLPGENSCSTLRSQFEKVLRQELDEHKRGTDVLKKLAAQHGVDTSNNALNSNTSFLQEKKSEIDELEARLKTCVSNLAQAKEIYKQRLQNENPLMLRLEQADVPFIVNTIEMIFTEAQSTSEAYQDLVSLMDTLGYKYNKNLNDEVVNRNVQEYLNFIDDHRDRLNVSPKLDQTQREQITTYLNEELPSMFLAGSSHMPSAAIIGKFRMAKTLAEVRMKYRNDVSAVLKRLTEIMDDIAENYNVNFQDPGVKNAVSSYRDLLAKNSRFLETVEIPEQYLKKVSELEILVEDASTKLLTPSTDSSFSLLSSVSSVLQKLGTLFGLGGSNLETLKSQIVKQNVECASFRKDFRAKAQEYQILKEEATHSGSEHESMDSGTNVAVSALLNEGSLDCVEQKVDNYIYQICMNKRDGAVIQKEDKPGGKSVLIGRFEDYRFDAEEAWERYMDDMRIKYSETDLISHLESDQGNYKFEPLVGNLPRKNSGLSIEYSGGDRCWNGPLRSAQVFFRCSDNFRLNSVHERTKCHYILDVSAPLGCSMLFKYEAPDWF